MSKLDTVILAGGLGTRLEPVLKGKPKCLAPINGNLFIDILLDDCIKQGLRRFILCLGYLKEQVIEHLSDRNDCEIVFSEEKEPLGTGGALKNTRPLIKSDPFLVMNGDSFIDFDMKALAKKQKNYLLSILLYKDNNGSDFGSVKIDDNGLLLAFDEKKNNSNNKYLNSGRYFFSKNIFNYLPNKKSFSLEKDVFPGLAKKFKINSLINNNRSFDIGTPERYSLFIESIL